jgi:hypothetical protein
MRYFPKNKIFSVIFLLTFLISGLSIAQNDGAGNTGLAFLKLGVGSRSISMGEAYSTICNDATAIIYNPSRLISEDHNNVVIMHSTSAADLTQDFIGAKYSYGKFAIGLGIFKASVDGIELRYTPGAAIDNFKSQDVSVSLSAAYKINNYLSIGITPKFLYEKIFTDESNGFGIDIGTNYFKDNYSFSFVLANLGSVNELKNISTKLPTSVRFGAGYIYPYNNFQFIFAVDGYKILDGGSFHINAGGEASFKNFLFVRFGYQTNYDSKSITTGIGLRYKQIYFDYAFVPYKYTLSNSNTFTLGLNF